MDINNIPFDQYQRYKVSTDIINLYKQYKKTSNSIRVLDVGGHAENFVEKNTLPIKQFLPLDKTTVIDIVECNLDDYIRGNGEKIPFDDDYFDFIVTNDVFEHVPPLFRESFLQEILRVANTGAVLTAPFYSAEIELAEEILNEFILNICKNKHYMLNEHIENGLPRVEDLEDTFKTNNLSYYYFSSGNLYSWLSMNLVKFYLTTLENTGNLHKKLDEFYNTMLSSKDMTTNLGYRKVFTVMKKDNDFLKYIAKYYNDKSKHDDYYKDIINFTNTIINMIQMNKQSVNQFKKIYSQEIANIATPPINSSYTYKEKFYITQSYLNRIDFLVGTHGKIQKGNIKVEANLIEEQGNLQRIYIKDVNITDIVDNAWLEINIPPVPFSKDKWLEVTISGENLDASEGVSIWKYKNKEDEKSCVKIYCRDLSILETLEQENYHLQKQVQQYYKAKKELEQIVRQKGKQKEELKEILEEKQEDISELKEMNKEVIEEINALRKESENKKEEIDKLVDRISGLERENQRLKKVCNELLQQSLQ